MKQSHYISEIVEIARLSDNEVEARLKVGVYFIDRNIRLTLRGIEAFPAFTDEEKIREAQDRLDEDDMPGGFN